MYFKKLISGLCVFTIIFSLTASSAKALILVPPNLPTKSNVVFIPGFEGSRLYRPSNGGFEDQLWEPDQGNLDVRKLFLDASGASLDPTVYTVDILDKGNLLPFVLPSIYKGFMDRMDDLVAQGVMRRWEPLPYDWRLAVDDVVSRGVERPGGTISYIDEVPEGDLPYMIKKIEEVADDSITGKVTIVTHSNGGLVAKALIHKLLEMKQESGYDLVDRIEKVIMVGVPQLGTPSATATMLHGEDMEFLYGLILNKKTAREFSENAPGAYGLLPSATYFDVVAEPEIVFDTSVSQVANFRTFYGNFIDQFSIRNQFLTASLDGRAKPAVSDLENPAVLNSVLLQKADVLHQKLDNLVFPESIEVTRVAGWGLETIKSIGYRAKRKCEPTLTGLCLYKDIVDSYPLFTVDGDNKVVSMSALHGQGRSFYLDLRNYNYDSSKNSKHANMFENEELLAFIESNVREEPFSSDYFTIEKPQDPGNMILSMHSPMSLSVADEQGRRTGVSSLSTEDFTVIDQEIPNSFYMEFGDNKYIGLPKEGTYSIEMVGEDYGEFTFIQETFQGGASQEKVVFAEIPAMPDIVATASVTNGVGIPELQIDTDADGEVDQTIQPQESFDPLVYIEMIRTKILALELPKKAEKQLLKKLENLEKKIQKGKIHNVEQRLKIFLHKLSHKDKKGKGPRFPRITSEQRSELVALFTELLDTIK